MKKYVALVCALAFIATVSCSKGPDADAKALIKSMTTATDAASEKLEKAAAAKDAGDAMIAYAQSMKTLAQKGKDLEKKYPNLKIQGDEKYKAESEMMMKSMDRFTKAMTGAMTKFAGAKELTEAAMKMGEIMKDVK